MGLVLIIVAVALVFEFINGFHDTANAIATMIATKVLTPRQAFGPVVAFLFHRRFRQLRPRPQADADFAKIYV